MRIVCLQTIFMKYHTFLCRKLGKILQNLLSAAVVIGALRVNRPQYDQKSQMTYEPSEDCNKPSQVPNLIKVFAVYVRQPWIHANQ